MIPIAHIAPTHHIIDIYRLFNTFIILFCHFILFHTSVSPSFSAIACQKQVATHLLEMR